MVGGVATLSMIVAGTLAAAEGEPRQVPTVATAAPLSPEPGPANGASPGTRLPAVSRASVNRAAATSPVLLRAERSRSNPVDPLIELRKYGLVFE